MIEFEGQISDTCKKEVIKKACRNVFHFVYAIKRLFYRKIKTFFKKNYFFAKGFISISIHFTVDGFSD